MVWLVVIHVLSAMLGLGPAFAFPWILRRASTVEEMKRNLLQVTYLEIFPKVFGSLAILSGLGLFFFGSYGPFMQVWIIGSLAIYVAIEILVIGFLNKSAKKLLNLIHEPRIAVLEQPSTDLISLYSHVRNLHMWSGMLSLLILILMIIKPH